MILGNLLKKALTIIPSSDFGYSKFLGRATNDIGIDVATYDTEITLKGSVQAVPRSLYQHMGLDWKRNYITIYNSDDIVGIERDSSGDKVTFDSKTFLVLDENDWKAIDGWKGILCVEVTE